MSNCHYRVSSFGRTTEEFVWCVITELWYLLDTLRGVYTEPNESQSLPPLYRIETGMRKTGCDMGDGRDIASAVSKMR